MRKQVEAVPTGRDVTSLCVPTRAATPKYGYGGVS
jgi:hypothetical protein